MDSLAREIRYAVRRLLRTPGFAFIVVLTLALGIGANSAIFSVVNAVLLRPLEYRQPEQLVTVEHFYPSLNSLRAPVSAPGFRDYKAREHVFERAAVETGWSPNLTGDGEPERLTGARVSADYFATLGIIPRLGRSFLAEEDEPGRNRVVILTDGLWHRLFGGERSAVGGTLTLNGERFEVIGVLPPGSRAFFNRNAELFTPLALEPAQFTDNRRTTEWLHFVGRLRSGVTVERAHADMRSFAEQLKQQYPDPYPTDWSLNVVSLQEQRTGNVRPALLVLLGAVGFVLLIACANVANLLLARGASRIKEVAIRSALGAKRWHLVRQLLAESVLLAVTGGALGLLLAWLGVRALVGLNPGNLPRADEIGVDTAVIAFTLALSLLTGILFGLVPALQASRPNLQESLKEGGRSASDDRGGKAIRRTLVVAEVALALILLAGAGLLIRSFARLSGVSPGFEPANLLTLQVSLPRTTYRSDTLQIAFYDQLLSRLASIRGVRSVGGTSEIPFGGSWNTSSFNVEGFQPAEGQPGPWGDVRVVSPGFLQALGAPLIRGRQFTEQDGHGAPPVAIVDDELVRRYWPNDDPIGKRIFFGAPGDTSRYASVIGVVGHTKHEGLDAENRIQLYLPLRQRGMPFLMLAVRTTGDPMAVLPAVREAIWAVDRDVPISQVRTMEQLVETSLGQRRLSTLLLSLFAAIALSMASIGIYGVMSYSVTQRGREIGVRMALGAQRSSVLTLVLRQGMLLTLLGVAIGLAGAFAVTRLLESQLFGVPASDPATFVAVALLLSAIAAAATLIPAWRASKMDPVEALRSEV